GWARSGGAGRPRPIGFAQRWRTTRKPARAGCGSCCRKRWGASPSGTTFLPRSWMRCSPVPKVLVIHGPNLNLLGEREPSIYGTMTLAEIDRRLQALARAEGASVEAGQTNPEGAGVGRPHAGRGR